MNDKYKKENRPDPFQNQSRIKYGFIYFEKNNHVAIKKWRGWASIGGKDAIAFTSIGELPMDVIWWTNLNKMEMWELGRYKNFKEDNFLGIDFKTLAQENSLLNDKVSDITRRWAEYFSLFTETMNKWASDTDKEWKYKDGNGIELLNSLINEPPPLQDVNVERILSEAYSDNITCLLPEEQISNMKTMVLSFPRFSHAERICYSSYPSSSLAPIKKTSFPATQENRLQWVKENSNDTPLLIQIENIIFNEGNDWSLNNLGKLFLGNRAGTLGNSNLNKIWLTSQEVIYLSTIARFDIAGGLMGNEWKKIDKHLDLIKRDTNFSDISVVKQIISTLFLQSHFQPGRNLNNRRKYPITSKEVWLKSKDKMYCFKAASIMQANGFPVLKYGNGQVEIAFDPKSNPNTLIEAAFKAELLLPNQLNMIAKTINTFTKENFNDIEGGLILNRWINKRWNDVEQIKEKDPVSLNIDRMLNIYYDYGRENIETIKNSTKNLLLLKQENNAVSDVFNEIMKNEVLVCVNKARSLIEN